MNIIGTERHTFARSSRNKSNRADDAIPNKRMNAECAVLPCSVNTALPDDVSNQLAEPLQCQ